ncbi:MAG: nicotinate (nicotinamide) nucleotide adenylyltransferase [Deltaproteobacteria bacterium]|nr:nicotinate (nicotinamide) nucleotide adenylyltransferase [Deltaproteobacteria bacterium]
MKAIAVYGGSFDPPHVAHVLCAAYVLSTAAVDEVLVVPTFSHALDKEPGAPFEHRFRMAELAMGELPRARVSRIEEELGGKSRTLTTLEALRARHPDATFRLVIGADILAETHRWHRWDRVVELAPPIVIGREGVADVEADVDHTLAMPEVSSTDIRARLAEGRPVDGLVPTVVADYVRRHGLYREPEA